MNNSSGILPLDSIYLLVQVFRIRVFRDELQIYQIIHGMTRLKTFQRSNNKSMLMVTRIMMMIYRVCERLTGRAAVSRHL